MTTAANIIERSQRLLNKLASGSLPSSSEYSDGLTALNAMLDSWRNEDLMCWALQEQTVTLTNGQASYTVGSGGDFNFARPLEIVQAWIVDNNISYPVTIITNEQYNNIVNKAVTGNWPDRLNYTASLTTGTALVWPVPNASRTMKLDVRTPLGTFAATSDTVTLPPGWERALAYNLAMELAPEYQTQTPPEVVRIAASSKAALKDANSIQINGAAELMALVGDRPRPNFYTLT